MYNALENVTHVVRNVEGCLPTKDINTVPELVKL